jgi:phage terminase large subunit-like protein
LTAARKKQAIEVLPVHVLRAIKCGPMPVLRDFEQLPPEQWTVGERVIAFAHYHLRNPDGPRVGQPMVLDVFQRAFILSVFDNPEGTLEGYLSVARRAGKTLMISVILLAFLVGPLAEQNADIASAANSRDQAALVFNFMHRILQMSPDLAGRWQATPSGKTIVGLSRQVTYKALSADARTGLGRGYTALVHDEAGQIEAANSDYVDMLRSSTAGGKKMLYLVVSTQAKDDSAYLSVQMDAAIRAGNPNAVVHLYTTNPNADLMDESQWLFANPTLGTARSVDDLRAQLRKAKEIPTQSGGARNLLLNQRVSQDTLFMSAEVWRRNIGPLTPRLPTSRIVLGLDLSLRVDMTACVAAWRNDGEDHINLEAHAFSPAEGMEQRAIRDKAPYLTWVDQGFLQRVPGPTVDYKWVCEYLNRTYLHDIDEICFDRYRIEAFQEAAKATGLYDRVLSWRPVGQGFVSMGPILDAFEGSALGGRFRTGGHPVLNMAASQAITAIDPAGNRKLTKGDGTGRRVRQSSRIDALVAAVMAAYPLLDGERHDRFDVAAYIG